MEVGIICTVEQQYKGADTQVKSNTRICTALYPLVQLITTGETINRSSPIFESSDEQSAIQ